jgi:adenine phosphoribosyltransferase
MSKTFDLDQAIRKVRDFPKPGILFYDITSILRDPEAFSYCIDRMEELYADKEITAIAGIEARGFLFAAPLAQRMGIPLILVRKQGKLPGEIYERRFDLEYGEDVIQIHKSDITEGDNILIVDDLIATGGTVKAAAELFTEAKARVEEIFCVIGLPFLPYKEVLKDYTVSTLIEYDHE